MSRRKPARVISWMWIIFIALFVVFYFAIDMLVTTLFGTLGFVLGANDPMVTMLVVGVISAILAVLVLGAARAATNR